MLITQNVKFMSFLKFPILFTADDYEQKENLKLKADAVEAIININTASICAYNEMDNKNVLVRMANGECYEVPLRIKDFENLLKEIESLIELTSIGGN